MTWFMIAIQILGALPELLKVAEQAFDNIPDSGAQKKEMVLTAAKALFGGLIGVSTGGQKNTWQRVEMMLSPIIDIMCRLFFPKEETKE